MLRFSLLLLAATHAGSKFGARPAGKLTRLHGTVTAFKHRRGYGFITGEGVISGDASFILSELKKRGEGDVEGRDGYGQYFFNRRSLDGGFFVTEGERVSFSVVPYNNSAGQGGSGGGGGHHFRAVSIRFYDRRTKKETLITPPTLRGVVVKWDKVQGHGVIGELDTEGKYHPALSPKFFFTVEEMDLAPGAEMREGRYVRFCVEDGAGDEEGAVESAEGQNASRVIIDASMERKKGALGNPMLPPGARESTGADVQSRFSGVVREVVSSDGGAARYGFVTDDLTGESIFFHGSDAFKGVKNGDQVTYLLREMTIGKHQGKKACFNIRRHDTASRAAAGDSLSDDDFDLLV